MSGIHITTSQNVDLEYEPAGVGYRILAAMLDEVFKIVYVVIILLLVGIYAKSESRLYDYQETNYGLITCLILASLPYMLYYFLSETFMNGQSFGKKIIGIKVIKLDGTQASMSSYLIRSLTRIIDRGLVALIAVAVTEKSQRLGDLAAGTTVIKLNAEVSLRETILYKPINEYKIVFEQVALLSDNNIAVIKQILEHSMLNNKKENLALLAKKIKDKMGVTTNLSDEVFLQTVLLDYSHYQFEK